MYSSDRITSEHHWTFFTKLSETGLNVLCCVKYFQHKSSFKVAIHRTRYTPIQITKNIRISSVCVSVCHTY